MTGATALHRARADEPDLGGRRFDVVLAMGLLHHLDDAECAALIGFAHASLDPGGRLVTIDPAYAPEQARVARWLIGRDRGEHPGHGGLPAARRLHLAEVSAVTRDDLLQGALHPRGARVQPGRLSRATRRRPAPCGPA